MRRQRVTLALAACVVAAILAAALWPGEREPKYHGKRLSEWLEQYQHYTAYAGWRPMPAHLEGDESIEAIAAVRHIGTNGLPLMLRWLRYSDRPTLIDQIASRYGKLPRAMRSQLIEGYFVSHCGQAHARAGVMASYCLARKHVQQFPNCSEWRAIGTELAARPLRVWCCGM